MLWRLLLLQACSSMRLLVEEAVPFPETCPNGELKLEPIRYKVSSTVVFEEKCTMMSLVGVATIQLEGELVFKRNATVKGAIDLVGRRNRRCLDMQERALFQSAHVNFRDCGGPDVDDGGGLYVEKKLVLDRSTLSFQRCQALYGGGIFSKGGITLTYSSLHLSECHAETGGGIFVFSLLHLLRLSHLQIRSCQAEGQGGGVVVRNGNMLVSGNITLEDCAASSAGGLHVEGKLKQFASTIRARNCTALGAHGGAMHVNHMDQRGGYMEITNSRAWTTGGGIHVDYSTRLWGSLNLSDLSASHGGGALNTEHLELRGQLHARNCSAMGGGVLKVVKKLEIFQGEMYLRNSRSFQKGGGVLAGSFYLFDGSVRLEETRAGGMGGGLYVAEEPVQRGGSLEITRSQAWVGGGIFATWVLQLGGRMQLGEVRSVQFYKGVPAGGGIAAAGGVVQGPKGELLIARASSAHSGGGIASSLVLTLGKLTIQNASAAEGGCIRVLTSKEFGEDSFKQRGAKSHLGRLISELNQLAAKRFPVSNLPQGERRKAALLGHSEFRQCRAEVGGGVMTTGPAEFAEVVFHGCESTSVLGGAALTADEGHFFKPVLLKDCFGPGNGVLKLQKSLRMENVSFLNCTAPQAVGTELDFKHVVVSRGDGGAAFLGQNRSFDSLLCDNGFEGYQDDQTTSCRPCRSGHFQLHGASRFVNGSLHGSHCMKVPAAGILVSPREVSMRPGFMVDSDWSMSLHCPNEMACPGGTINASGAVNMCEKGYQGPGCADCAQTHGRVSSDPFACATCAQSQLRKTVEWSVYLLENTVVFAVSASGVIFVSEESYRSTIYSNQLMAYVMVSVPVLNQLSNSRTFKTLTAFVQDSIGAMSLPVDLANAGSEGQSSECLLHYLGIPKTLYGGDLLFLAIAVSLMLILSMLVDVWSAIVVTGNCYLPRLCSSVGRHLVCYRLTSESEGGSLHCGFDHDVSMPMPLALVLLLLMCMLGALYLTQPYKGHRDAWEVTVLLRKLLLAVASSVWPSSSNAVMQLGLLGLILLCSLVLTMQHRPYLSEEHNDTEARLLSFGMLMILATFSFQANEQSWAKMESTQLVNTAVIVCLATGPAVYMTAKVVWALLVEFEVLQDSSSPQKEPA